MGCAHRPRDRAPPYALGRSSQLTLAFSRHQFVWPTFLQTTETVCEGLDRAWMFFGGIIATLIPDNTKAMINEPDAR